MILQELASREIARRSILHFITRFHRDYMPGWVHHELCEKLKEFAKRVLEGKSPRLMVMMPPRLGKSTIASQYFPAWFLGNNPDQEVIGCSYALSLQLAFSRRIRSLLSDPMFQVLFPQARLSSDSQNIEGWRTEEGGGFKPAGRGGPINGFGCIDVNSVVITRDGPMPMSSMPKFIYNLKNLRHWDGLPGVRTKLEVLAYDHERQRTVWVEPTVPRWPRKEWTYKLTTASGKSLSLTDDHRVYVAGAGYVEARMLCIGDPLVMYEEATGTAEVDILVEASINPELRLVLDLSTPPYHNFFADGLLVHNCNILVIDDIIKNSAEGGSESVRDAAWDWYRSTARTRLAPGGGILVIGTRWHWDDPMGRMELMGAETGDKFEIVRYPALAYEDEPQRKKGEALHPERYSVQDLETIRATLGPSLWEALYQQNPTPDTGGYFETTWFRRYSETPGRSGWWAAWIRTGISTSWMCSATAGIPWTL